MAPGRRFLGVFGGGGTKNNKKNKANNHHQKKKGNNVKKENEVAAATTTTTKQQQQQQPRQQQQQQDEKTIEATTTASSNRFTTFVEGAITKTTSAAANQQQQQRPPPPPPPRRPPPPPPVVKKAKSMKSLGKTTGNNKKPPSIKKAKSLKTLAAVVVEPPENNNKKTSSDTTAVTTDDTITESKQQEKDKEDDDDGKGGKEEHLHPNKLANNKKASKSMKSITTATATRLTELESQMIEFNNRLELLEKWKLEIQQREEMVATKELSLKERAIELDQREAEIKSKEEEEQDADYKVIKDENDDDDEDKGGGDNEKVDGETPPNTDTKEEEEEENDNDDGPTEEEKEAALASRKAEHIKRKKMIKDELNSIIKQTEEEELDPEDGPFELEAIQALKIAASKICFLKKYYDVMKDELIYFPTVSKSILDYSLMEEAEKYYWEEDDEFPMDYSIALRTIVSSKIDVTNDDDDDAADDDYMAALAMDVEIMEDDEEDEDDDKENDTNENVNNEETNDSGPEPEVGNPAKNTSVTDDPEGDGEAKPDETSEDKTAKDLASHPFLPTNEDEEEPAYYNESPASSPSPSSPPQTQQQFQTNFDIDLGSNPLENDGQTKEGLDDSSNDRRSRIVKELDKILNQASAKLLDDDIPIIKPKSMKAIKKAAIKVAYRKRFYDAETDNNIEFPTVARTIVDGSIFEEARKAKLTEEQKAVVLAIAEEIETTTNPDLDYEFMDMMAEDMSELESLPDDLVEESEKGDRSSSGVTGAEGRNTKQEVAEADFSTLQQQAVALDESKPADSSSTTDDDGKDAAQSPPPEAGDDRTPDPGPVTLPGEKNDEEGTQGNISNNLPPTAIASPRKSPKAKAKKESPKKTSKLKAKKDKKAKKSHSNDDVPLLDVGKGSAGSGDENDSPTTEAGEEGAQTKKKSKKNKRKQLLRRHSSDNIMELVDAEEAGSGTDAFRSPRKPPRRNKSFDSSELNAILSPRAGGKKKKKKNDSNHKKSSNKEDSADSKKKKKHKKKKADDPASIVDADSSHQNASVVENSAISDDQVGKNLSGEQEPAQETRKVTAGKDVVDTEERTAKIDQEKAIDEPKAAYFQDMAPTTPEDETAATIEDKSSAAEEPSEERHTKEGKDLAGPAGKGVDINESFTPQGDDNKKPEAEGSLAAAANAQPAIEHSTLQNTEDPTPDNTLNEDVTTSSVSAEEATGEVEPKQENPAAEQLEHVSKEESMPAEDPATKGDYSNAQESKSDDTHVVEETASTNKSGELDVEERESKNSQEDPAATDEWKTAVVDPETESCADKPIEQEAALSVDVETDVNENPVLAPQDKKLAEPSKPVAKEESVKVENTTMDERNESTDIPSKLETSSKEKETFESNADYESSAAQKENPSVVDEKTESVTIEDVETTATSAPIDKPSENEKTPKAELTDVVAEGECTIGGVEGETTPETVQKGESNQTEDATEESVEPANEENVQERLVSVTEEQDSSTKETSEDELKGDELQLCAASDGANTQLEEVAATEGPIEPAVEETPLGKEPSLEENVAAASEDKTMNDVDLAPVQQEPVSD